MIKLYLPDCELAEFLRIFEYIFQYLKVEKYLILTDLVKGDSLIRSVYGNNNFLKKYNPLQNLIWNAKTKIWMNHKLFSKTFEYLYPELFFQRKRRARANFELIHIFHAAIILVLDLILLEEMDPIESKVLWMTSCKYKWDFNISN